MRFLTRLLISLMENVTSVTSPMFFFFFFGVLELLKFVLSLRRQVADFTASEKVGEEVAYLVSPSLFKCFCAEERPFGCRVCCPFSWLGLPFGALWWEASCLC